MRGWSVSGEFVCIVLRQWVGVGVQGSGVRGKVFGRTLSKAEVTFKVVSIY